MGTGIHGRAALNWREEGRERGGGGRGRGRGRAYPPSQCTHTEEGDGEDLHSIESTRYLFSFYNNIKNKKILTLKNILRI